MNRLLMTLVLLVCAGRTLAETEHRTIAAGGSITEIMYALGLGDEIIAVDSSSYFPTDAALKPKVGYFRQLSAEGVLSTMPTRVVASNGAGPDEALSQIRRAGVEVKVFKQEIYNLKVWKAFLREVGEYFDHVDQAEQIIARVDGHLAGVLRPAAGQERTAIFLMDIGDRGPVAAGLNTVPNMLFDLAHFKNIVTEFEGYRPYSAEQLIQSKPDVIVMPSHSVEKMGGVKNICQNMTMAMATAERGCDILVMDALLALGFGTRIDEAVAVLTRHEF